VRQRFTIICITTTTIATACSMALWSMLIIIVPDKYAAQRMWWYVSTLVFFSIVFAFQGLTVTLLMKSYLTIKTAAVTLGLT